MLRTQVYLGATYQLSKMVNVAGVAELTLLDKTFYPSLTASADVRLLRNVSAAVSYSVMPGNYVNVGAALTAKLGPVQLYASTDNVLAANYTSTQSLNGRFGINLLFGHRDKKKKEKEEEEPVMETVVVPVKKAPEVKKDTVVKDTIVKDTVVKDTATPVVKAEPVVISPVKEEMMVEEESPWYVIVGSFKNKQKAEILRRKLHFMGFKNSAVLEEGEGMFRVSAACYNTHAACWEEVFRIRKEYPQFIDAWGLSAE